MRDASKSFRGSLLKRSSIGPDIHILFISHNINGCQHGLSSSVSWYVSFKSFSSCRRTNVLSLKLAFWENKANTQNTAEFVWHKISWAFALKHKHGMLSNGRSFHSLYWSHGHWGIISNTDRWISKIAQSPIWQRSYLHKVISFVYNLLKMFVFNFNLTSDFDSRNTWNKGCCCYYLL